MAAPSITLYDKGSPGCVELGECPFCQRVAMTLRLKNLAFTSVLVDTTNKPTWFLELNPKGTVPVIKYNDVTLPDSDDIVVMLEKHHPEPKLIPDDLELMKLGSGLGAADAYLKNKDEVLEAELLGKYRAELDSIAAHLATPVAGKFAVGDELSAVDCKIVPRLRNARHAVRHFGKWDFSQEEKYRGLSEYIDRVMATEVFKASDFRVEVLEKRWAALLV